ncbi:hypothetical protein HK100_010198 [Physocladia obscura]|uniref:PPIase cyclophilin-type domain-containing protein n=1 Tax=Physocladia obscura TaxID=109957 RepID=A0AAD5XIY9_9FUNG|nr:hypothetical protein HK100_010198 [Physocladia obscura]
MGTSTTIRTTTTTKRVVIVGGGIAGLALAVALKRLDAQRHVTGVGYSTLVVEGAPSTGSVLSEDGQHVVLWRWAVDALVADLRVGSQLAGTAAPIVGMSALDPSDLHVPLRQFPPPASKLGASTQLDSPLPPLVAIRRCDLVRLLMRALAQPAAGEENQGTDGGEYLPRPANNSRLTDAVPENPATGDLAEGRWFEAQDFARRLGPDVFVAGDRVKVFYVHPHTGKVTVELRSGRVETADVLVGADGPNSAVRRLMYLNVAPARQPRVLGFGSISPTTPTSPTPSLAAYNSNNPRPVEYSGAAVFCGVTRLHVPPTDAPDVLEVSRAPIDDLTRGDVQEFVPDGRCVTVFGAAKGAWFGCSNLGNGLLGWRLVVPQDEKGHIAANYAAAKNRQLMNDAIKANPKAGTNIMSMVSADAIGGQGVQKKLGTLTTDETNPEDKWNANTNANANTASLPRKPGKLRIDALTAEALIEDQESQSSASASSDSRKSFASESTKSSRRGHRSVDITSLQTAFKDNGLPNFAPRKYSASEAENNSPSRASSRATFVASSIFGAPNPLTGQEIRMLALRHAEPENFPHPIYAIIARTDPALTTLSDTVDLASKPLETFTLPNPNPAGTPPPPSLHRGRVFLIGSAAHPITINANGSLAPSLAITDAVLLAKLLGKHLDPNYVDPMTADILTPGGRRYEDSEGFEKFMAGAMAARANGNVPSDGNSMDFDNGDDDDDDDPAVREERRAYERLANEFDQERVALAADVMRDARRESGRFGLVSGGAKALLNSSVVKGLWRIGKGLLAAQQQQQDGSAADVVNEETENFDLLMTRGAVKKGRKYRIFGSMNDKVSKVFNVLTKKLQTPSVFISRKAKIRRSTKNGVISNIPVLDVTSTNDTVYKIVELHKDLRNIPSVRLAELPFKELNSLSQVIFTAKKEIFEATVRKAQELEFITNPQDISITGKKLTTKLPQSGNRPFRPKFNHDSTISVRVWSSKIKDFCRICIGAGVWDDTPLIAVSHTWHNAVSFEFKLPHDPNYTDNIFKACKSAAKKVCSTEDQQDYYVWVDYLCTVQNNNFEVREATMKMAWIYSAATVTVVILDAETAKPGDDSMSSYSHAEFLSNRVWAMQEETLSSELMFFGRDGQDYPKKITKITDVENPEKMKYMGDEKFEIQVTRYKDEDGIVIAEPREIMKFFLLWPKMIRRHGGWPCDRIYASQYCSELQHPLEVRYDVSLSQILAVYVHKLIKAGDISVTGISMTEQVPGWGCTSVFLDFSEFFVYGPLGFIGGFGSFHDVPANIPQKTAQVFLDYSRDGRLCGRIIIELYDNVAPKTAQFFRSLCSQQKFNGFLLKRKKNRLAFSPFDNNLHTTEKMDLQSRPVDFGTLWVNELNSDPFNFNIYIGESTLKSKTPLIAFGKVVEGLPSLYVQSNCVSEMSASSFGVLPIPPALELDPAVGLLVKSTVIIAIVNINQKFSLKKAIMKRQNYFLERLIEPKMIESMLKCYWDIIDYFCDPPKLLLGNSSYISINSMIQKLIADLKKGYAFLGKAICKELNEILKFETKIEKADAILTLISTLAVHLEISKFDPRKSIHFDVMMHGNCLMISESSANDGNTKVYSAQKMKEDLQMYRFNSGSYDAEDPDPSDIPSIVFENYFGNPKIKNNDNEDLSENSSDVDKNSSFEALSRNSENIKKNSRDSIDTNSYDQADGNSSNAANNFFSFSRRQRLLRVVNECLQQERLSDGVVGYGRKILIQKLSANKTYALDIFPDGNLNELVLVYGHEFKEESSLPEAIEICKLDKKLDMGWNIVRGVKRSTKQ